MAKVTLKWKQNNEASKFLIERKASGPKQYRSGIMQGISSLFKPMTGGWRTVAKNIPGNQTIFEDSVEFPMRRLIRPTYTGNSKIDPHQGYEYRITPYDREGKAGSPTYASVFPKPLSEDGTPLSPEDADRYVFVDMNKSGTIKFKVTDVDGNPIKNAEVTLAANRR
jgi:hypothetical protein